MRNFIEEVELFDRDGVDLAVRILLVGDHPRDEVGCVPCSEPECNRSEIMKEVVVCALLT